MEHTSGSSDGSEWGELEHNDVEVTQAGGGGRERGIDTEPEIKRAREKGKVR